MSTNIKTDILVIGAGAGGLVVAVGAAQMGAEVVLLEGNKMGGDCLNSGCIPSKALLACGHAAHSQAASARFGVSAVKPKVDFSAVKNSVQEVIAEIAPKDSEERLASLGVRVIREFGAFISPSTVKAGPFIISARRIVIATGSSPMVPPIAGLDQIPFDTSDSIFDLEQRPDHLLVVGGGAVGIEIAQAHRRLGSTVTVLEADRILNGFDAEPAAVVRDALISEGLRIIEGATVSSLSQHDGGILIATDRGDKIKGSHVLVAVGRKPNIERLNLESARIIASAAGIETNARLRTSNRRVYAIGDVAGGAQFTHVAGYHAGLVLRALMFLLPTRVAPAELPLAVYTDPEIARVGMSQEAAVERYGAKLATSRFALCHNDRAITNQDTVGFIEVLIVRGRPVGVTIVGHQAAELINFWCLALKNRLKMSQIVGIVTPYPTLGELNKSVASAYFAPKLFENPHIKRLVNFVQRWVP